jgi:copper chaperone
MHINLTGNSELHQALDLPTMARFKLCFWHIANSIHTQRNFKMMQTFIVTGMTCGHCEKAVTRAVKQFDPQAEVKIDRAANKVEVQSEQSRTLLSKAIAEEGYAVAA